MKRFAVAFFVMALFLSNLSAQAASATFATRTGEIFQFYLNGRLLNGRGSNLVRIDRLPAGPQNIEFRVPARRGFLTFCSKVFLDRGFETNYILVLPDHQPNFLLKEVGRKRLIAPVCNTCPPPRPNGNGYNNNIYDDYDYYQNQQNYEYGNNNQNGGYGNNSGGNNYGPNNGNNFNSGSYSNPAPVQAYMNRYDVDQLLQTIQSKNFESSKLDIAKQALGNTSILAEDVKRLMGAFSFESSRLDFAKFAYPRVYDPQNFYRINDAFEFESSISEMQRWLKK